MLKQRIITACIMALLFLVALFFMPEAGWRMLVTLLVMQGVSEWARLAQMSTRASYVYSGLTLALMAALMLAGQPGLSDAAQPLSIYVPSWAMLHLAVYAVSGVMWLVVAPFWMAMKWQVRKPVPMALAGWAVLIPTALAMVDLRAYNPLLLLGVMALVWIADIAAYFAGRKYGRHKLAPNISPGKTWEGVFGAMIAVSLCMALAAIFGIVSIPLVFVINVLIASCCWVALAVLGDLFESMIKRQAGVKDSGTLLPGHGGLLDRVDALTSTLPLAALALLLQRLV